MTLASPKSIPIVSKVQKRTCITFPFFAKKKKTRKMVTNQLTNVGKIYREKIMDLCVSYMSNFKINYLDFHCTGYNFYDSTTICFRSSRTYVTASALQYVHGFTISVQKYSCLYLKNWNSETKCYGWLTCSINIDKGRSFNPTSRRLELIKVTIK